MASVLKVDTLQKPDGSTPTAADLGLDVAGSVVQVVTKDVPVVNADTLTNTSYSGTTDSIIQAYASTIQPKLAGSKIVVEMTTHMVARRDGPANAKASIGYTYNQSSSAPTTASGYTETTDQYVNRKSFGGGIGDNYGIASTGTAVLVSNPSYSVGDYVHFTLMTKTTYSNANASYNFNEQSQPFTVRIYEIAQ